MIYCTLGNYSKPVATIILPKFHTVVAIFVKVSKVFTFLVKYVLGNFYSNLASFYWSHWSGSTLTYLKGIIFQNYFSKLFSCWADPVGYLALSSSQQRVVPKVGCNRLDDDFLSFDNCL